MANESRRLNKRLIEAEGLQGSRDNMIIQDGDYWTLIGGAQIGASGQPITLIAAVLASLDFAAIQPAGSSGAAVLDVPLTGVTPGDMCLAAPVQSVPLHIVWGASCYSAGVVNVRVVHTASGNIDLGATDWRIAALRFA